MSYSTREFVLEGGWLDAFHAAYGSKAPLFVARRSPDGAITHRIDRLLKSLTSSTPASIQADLTRPISLEPGKLALQIAHINTAIGRHFTNRHGYRDQPLLVVSHMFPWATFFSPVSDAKGYFENTLSQLFAYAATTPLPKDALIAAIALIVVVSHPFVDCNGRTARVALFVLLRSFLRLTEDDAFRYADLFSGANSSFVVALWEIRESGNYNYYMDLMS